MGNSLQKLCCCSRSNQSDNNDSYTESKRHIPSTKQWPRETDITNLYTVNENQTNPIHISKQVQRGTDVHRDTQTFSKSSKESTNYKSSTTQWPKGTDINTKYAVTENQTNCNHISKQVQKGVNVHGDAQTLSSNSNQANIYKSATKQGTRQTDINNKYANHIHTSKQVKEEIHVNRETKTFSTKSNEANDYKPQVVKPKQKAVDFTLVPYAWTKEGLTKLKNLAHKYIQMNSSSYSSVQIKHFFRNKPYSYFDDILNNKDGIMETRLKDSNGDRKCPINGRLDGIFFSAMARSDGTPPSNSPFGDTRFLIPVDRMLSHSQNLYFADFYCNNRKNHPHYVTLVITDRRSKADNFCMENLIKLDLFSNPYLTIDRYGNCCVDITVVVEIFYTENVNLADQKNYYGATLKRVGTFGRGQACFNGIPKNSSCRTCNLN